MSIFKDNLLAKNSSFIESADALLRSSVQQERFRATLALEALDRVRSGILGGSKLNQLFGDIGQLSNIIGSTLGLGSKAVGPISELPIEQRIKVNEWRFTKTKTEHRVERNNALRRTPDPGQSLFGLDADTISLFPGQLGQDREQLINKYGPLDNGMLPYSIGDGADAVANYIGKTFPFRIRNLARIGTAPGPEVGPLQPGERRNQKDLSSEIFPAYIRSLNEQFNVSWSQRGYLGRSEEVYLYNSASRAFNLDLTLFATNDDQPLPQITPDTLQGLPAPQNGYPIPVANLISVPGLTLPGGDSPALMNNAISKTDLWRKISFLESLCYPQYDENNRYSRSPFAILDLGSLYENQLMIIQSLNISYDPMVWDINGEYYTPMFANITIAGVLIHSTAPGILASGEFGFTDDENNIRFLHRSDFR